MDRGEIKSIWEDLDETSELGKFRNLGLGLCDLGIETLILITSLDLGVFRRNSVDDQRVRPISVDCDAWRMNLRS